MQPVDLKPLWAGRAAAVIGVILIALNLRSAVAALSPILGLVDADIPLTSIGIGLLGMLPPLAFAVSGLVAPLVARRLGLEATMAVACVAMVIGPLVRAEAPSYSVLVAGSVVVLAGMGFGNILLPPMIKKYFPDRVALLTATYVTLMSVSASVPPLVAAPLADAVGWRISIGAWAVFAVAALVPWTVVWLSQRRTARRSADAAVQIAPPQLLGQMGRSRTAIAISMAFAVTSLNVYAIFAWLPEIVADTAGTSPAEAGALVALYAAIGLPLGLLAPLVVSRVANQAWLILLGVAFFFAGYLGLLLAPTTATALWVVLAGLGPLLFPLSLVLINLRTRTQAGSIALSGFVQGIGYGVGATGPLILGLLHDLTDGWTIPLVFLLATAVLAVPAAVVLARPSFVEDEIDAEDLAA